LSYLLPVTSGPLLDDERRPRDLHWAGGHGGGRPDQVIQGPQRSQGVDLIKCSNGSCATPQLPQNWVGAIPNNDEQ